MALQTAAHKVSSSATRSWTLLGVFAPTMVALASMRWGSQGLELLGTVLSPNIGPPEGPASGVLQAKTSLMDASVSATVPTSSMDALRTQYSASCPDHQFRTSIFSSDPLIMYIENYLSPQEIEYLLEVATPQYQKSPVSQGTKLKTYNEEIRSSMSAVLGTTDPVVRCVEQRSVDYQGFLPLRHLEDLQVVKYGISDHFRPHYDWFAGDSNPRISSFFVYLACDGGRTSDGQTCKGGATQFPDYRGRFPARWCRFIDCYDDSGVGGVAFKPIPGNAIFWANLYPNGTGHAGVWHAGMPVLEGRKVGMNILTRRDVLGS